MNDFISFLIFIAFYTLASSIIGLFFCFGSRWSTRRILRNPKSSDKKIRSLISYVKTTLPILTFLVSGICGPLIYWFKFRQPLLDEVKAAMEARGMDTTGV